MAPQNRLPSHALDPTSCFTQEQANQIFEIYRQVAVDNVKLELECMRKESEARVVATNAAATAAVIVASNAGTRKTTEEDDYFAGEIPPEVKTISLRITFLP